MLLHGNLSSQVVLRTAFCRLHTLRAHFHIISFAKNGWRMSIISTRFNDFECMLWKVGLDSKINHISEQKKIIAICNLNNFFT